MNKNELTAAIRAQMESWGAGASPTTPVIRATVDAFVEVVSQALENGEEVRLNDFGTFRTAQRSARTGRNPHTGAEIPIVARKVATFRPAKTLKYRVA